MPNWLRDTFNDWLGSNVTHIANAYPNSDYVWVVFDSERWTIPTVTLSNGQYAVKIETIKNKEKFRIDFKTWDRKDRRTSLEYLSIFAPRTRGNDTDLIILCENREIPANRSYIVTRSGTVVLQKYGGDLWTDESGRDHQPH